MDDDARIKPSTLALLTELLDERTRRLRARPRPTPAPEGDEPHGMARLAFLLRQLAEPVTSPRDTLSFLEEHRLGTAAALLARYLATPAGPLARFLADLWSSIHDDLAHAPVQRDRDGNFQIDPGTVRDGPRGRYLLAATDASEPKLVHVDLDEVHEDGPRLWRAQARRLDSGMLAYATAHDDAFLTELFARLDALAEAMKRAPEFLRDVRRLLELAAGLVDTAACQGDDRSHALAALERAKAYYDAARRELVEGKTGEAVERIRQAMQRIALSAAHIAELCAEGTQQMPGLGPSLAVAPDDHAVLGAPPLPTAEQGD